MEKVPLLQEILTREGVWEEGFAHDPVQCHCDDDQFPAEKTGRGPDQGHDRSVPGGDRIPDHGEDGHIHGHGHVHVHVRVRVRTRVRGRGRGRDRLIQIESGHHLHINLGIETAERHRILDELLWMD